MRVEAVESGHGASMHMGGELRGEVWQMAGIFYLSTNRAHTSTGDDDGSAKKCKEECGVEHDIVWPDVEEGLEQASMQSILKMQVVGGVGACYLPQALLLPQ
jgi:hypothetical protein